LEPGVFCITYKHRDYGTDHIILDEKTLRPVERSVAITPRHPKELTTPTIDFDDISVRLADDVGSPNDSPTKYVLRWETLEAHHDRPRQSPLPPASMLKLVKLQRK
jgi:hypothetical protein